MKLGYAILLALITFVVGGVVAAFAIFALMANRRGNRRAPIVTLERPTLLVARQKITQWSTVREPEQLFEVQETLSGKVPASFVPGEKLLELRGRRVRVTVPPGTVLLDDHLLKKEVTGIDSMLEKGKRAMAVPITADKAVGFFVVPGCKADVIHTVNGNSGILLENLLVLAIDQMPARPEDKVGMVGTTATLQMDNPEQVLKLSAALIAAPFGSSCGPLAMTVASSTMSDLPPPRPAAAPENRRLKHARARLMPMKPATQSSWLSSLSLQEASPSRFLLYPCGSDSASARHQARLQWETRRFWSSKQDVHWANGARFVTPRPT